MKSAHVVLENIILSWEDGFHYANGAMDTWSAGKVPSERGEQVGTCSSYVGIVL